MAKKIAKVEDVEILTESKVEKIKKPKTKTVSYYGRLGVICGLNNEEILDVLIDIFPEKDWNKYKSYPSWYRNEVKNRELDLDWIQKSIK